MSDTRDSSLGGSSLVHGAQPSSFDLRQESDVIALLKLVHQNSVDLDIKNHLRDLIFAFRQSMQEEDLEKVRQGFLPLGVAIKSGLDAETPAPSEVKAVKKPTWGMRPSPRFAVASEQKVEPAQTPLSVSVPKIEVEIAKPSAPEKAAVEVATEAPKVVEEIPAVVPAPVAPHAEPVVYVDYGERIKEIKRVVNEKVGNPVNLIDSHNEIGREYMNALLDAMKKTSGGGIGGAAEAMARLEKAFEQVRKVVILGNEAPVQAPTPAPAPVTAPVEEKVIIPEPVLVHDEPKAVEVPQSHVEQQFEETKAVTPIAKEDIPQAVLKTEPEKSKEAVPAEPIAPVRRASVRERLQGDAPQEVRQAQPAPIEGGLHSVAKDKQLQDLLRANRQQEALTFKQQEDARIAAMDPLQAPDVTSGLSQLLSEWSLFKSSGIFGTGPSGKDHPLYQKIALLTMAAVIAGRFEGATTAIKQSITDYMNGWRYEEGITHEHGETFEHYLRRVVRHILTKQKR